MTSWFFGTLGSTFGRAFGQQNVDCSSLTESLLQPLREQLQGFTRAIEEKNRITNQFGQAIVQNLLAMRPEFEQALKQNLASCPAEHQLIQDGLWIIQDFAARWRDSAHMYDIIEWYLNTIDQWEQKLLETEQETFTEQHPCVASSTPLLQSIVGSLNHFLQQPRDYSFYLRTLQPQISQLQQSIQSTSMMNRKCAQEMRFMRQGYDLLTRAAQVMQNLYNDYEEDTPEEMNLAQAIHQFDSQLHQWLLRQTALRQPASATLQTLRQPASAAVNRFSSTNW